MPLNRWNKDIRKGMHVLAHHPRGGHITGVVASFDTMKGYGKQAKLANGAACGLDDIIEACKPEKLPVIFRAERGGLNKDKVTAVFPTLPDDRDGDTVVVYSRVGQHSRGTWRWYHNNTRPAKPKEYEALLLELRGIYETLKAPGDRVYSLRVSARVSPAHRRTYYAAVVAKFR